MTSSKLFFLILIAVIFGGVYYWQENDSGSSQTTNEEMLENGSMVPITTQADVMYFEGAKGYFVRPQADGVYPGVVMIHENRGLRPEIVGMADQLAREGYMVLAVDLLGGVVETQDEARALTANFNQDVGVANMRAAVAYLKEQGATKMASLGWCFGGRQSLALATSGEKLDATVVYYGGGMPTSTTALAPISWPVLGIFGNQDRAIPVEMVNDFEASLDTLNIPNEVYIYPGVGHAFANPSGANYAPEETKDAWIKTMAFLKERLQ